MKKGFTLIELLVVISIIGILSTLLFVSFTSAQRQTRDAKRKSDLRQYQTSLEVYANRNGGLYPNDPSVVSAAGSLCTSLSLTNCPDDPKTPDGYSYVSAGGSGVAGGPSASQYVLFGMLEGSSDLFVVCSTGKVGNYEGTISSGVCPI